MTEATLTIKQETFAQKYIETGVASEAYRIAYDTENMMAKTVWEEASRLLADPKVSARVKELKALHQERHEITVDSITQELIEDRQFAREQGQAAAAISATVHKAKLHGLMVDKQEVTGKDGGAIITEDRTPLETARRIAFLLSQASQKQPE